MDWRIIGVLAFCLAGCATNYQSRGWSGGYSETQLDENMFMVSFQGNGYTAMDRAIDFTLLRSAALTLENGYNYFATIEANSSTSNSTYTTPITTLLPLMPYP
jgi:hypothetical protein